MEVSSLAPHEERANTCSRACLNEHVRVENMPSQAVVHRSRFIDEVCARNH